MKPHANRTEKLNRRDFVRGSSFASLMLMLGGVELQAEDKPAEGEEGTNYVGQSTPVKCAMVGCGVWGREVLKTLARIPNAPVVAICDTYEPWVNRAHKEAPAAEKLTDYRRLLERKDVEGVIVATPTHQHRPIVLDALQAGKHVYCEAPLAATVEDSRAIVQAARAAVPQYFQAGLQGRADPQIYYLCKFIRSGIMGRPVKGRCQWHRRESWRRAAADAAREQELNWRLQNHLSPGLIGEVGVHHLDIANWFLMSPPTAVSGVGCVAQWNDGREVPDTVHVAFEYPENVLVTYDGTLANSFDADHAVFYGTQCAILMRERRSWMFKEADAPVLGWEVYARKDAFYKESGIVLGANFTKQAAHGGKPADDPLAGDETPLHYALKAFATNSALIQAGVANFKDVGNPSDAAALRDYLATLAPNLIPAAGCKEGHLATVTVLKANEALLGRQRIVFDPAWFTV